MDLKTYAVFRKLNKNSDLLKYVVNHQAVPLEVLNNDMKDLLDDLHDADAECVVNDYQKYLQEHVQMNFVPDGKDQFDVNGEVAEPLMESIELVHHVNRKDVVHDLVANVMNNLRGERDVKVDHIKLAASAKAFVALTKQPVLDVDTDQQTDSDQQTDEATQTDSDEATQTDSEDQTDAATQMNSEAQTDAATQTNSEDQMDSETQTDDATQMNSEDQQVKDASVTDQNINYLKKPLPKSNIQPEPPLFEEPDDDVPEDIEDILPEGIEDGVPDNLPEQPVEEAAVETSEPQENPFKKAYDFLVDELRNRKIDERLPGLHLA